MIEFIKTRTVEDPVWNPEENAGIDVYIPEINSFTSEELVSFGNGVTIEPETNEINIAPHSDVKIPLGIKSKFPKNVALIANNKSGIATEKKLVFGASVIDNAYQGEWHVHLINTSDTQQTIEFGQKIIQFIPHYICTEGLIVRNMSADEFFTEKTERGNSGFGSTGV